MASSRRWLVLGLLLIAAASLGHFSGLVDQLRELQRLHDATSGAASAIASEPPARRPRSSETEGRAAPQKEPQHTAAQQQDPPAAGSFKQHLPAVLPFRGPSASLAGSPPAVPDASGVPGDFDAAVYMAHYPDVANSFTGDAADSAAVRRHAITHYQLHGRSERRVHGRLPVTVRYTACGGLMNQQYSHLAALVVAGALGADLIAPQAMVRDSFANYFHTKPALNKLAWRHVPFSSLWDTDGIVRSGRWQLHASPSLASWLICQPIHAAGMIRARNMLD
jgi:hypothetical protein